MFFYYLLTASSVILLIALVSYVIMKRANQGVRKNKIDLAICTVLAVVCATLTPLLANFLVNRLYFSFLLSLFLSFVFLVFLSAGAFVLIQRVFVKQENQSSPESNDEHHQESEKTEPNDAAGLAGLNEAISVDGDTSIDKAITFNEPEGLEPAVGFDEAVSFGEADDFDEVVNLNKAVAEPSILPRLVDQALENKNNHQYYDAISAYERALDQETDTKLLELVIIDLCALYKMTNQKELVHKILESDKYKLSDLGIREDILQNL